MKFLEKTLEDIIFNNLFACVERGLKIHRHRYDYISMVRQLNLGSYGIADLVLVEFSKNFAGKRELIVTIVECKLGAVGLNTYHQVLKYKAAIKFLINSYNLENTEVIIKTCLVGSDVIENEVFDYVIDNDLTCNCYSYTYEFDGIKFHQYQKGRSQCPSSFPDVKLESLFKKAFAASIKKESLRPNSEPVNN